MEIELIIYKVALGCMYEWNLEVMEKNYVIDMKENGLVFLLKINL